MKILFLILFSLCFLESNATTIDFSIAIQDSVETTDSLSYDKEVVDSLLEHARQHWLNAVSSLAEGDTITVTEEFENALDYLMEISAFADVEENKDFQDLTKSILDDYQNFISSSEKILSHTSIFALRERLNIDIEKNNVQIISIPNKLLNSTQIPMVVNEYVERIFSFFQNKGRGHFERWLGLTGKYFPMMTKIFDEEGVPQELKYLAMCESGLNPNARSWAKAVGMWQFMKGTGKMYGLRYNYWFDERRDFEKSTRAAARHLKDLHTEYNDWYLAIGAYNSGGGRINRGIRKSGSRDFWSMRQFLPRETRNYVPQYIGVTLMGLRPEIFGFVNIPKLDEIKYEYVTVDDCVDLGILAECAETELKDLKELNPELLRWCTPPNYKGYQLRIPFGKSEIFYQKFSLIDNEKKQNWIVHTVRRGETLSKIANRYGIGSSVIREVNNMGSKTKLSVGKEIVIPVSKSSTYASQIENIKEYTTTLEKKTTARKVRKVSTSSVPVGRDKVIYLVKKGDTISEIAEWFDVRASDVRNWNDISYGRNIYVGQKITIFVPKNKIKEYKLIAEMNSTSKNSKAASKIKPSTKTPKTHIIKDGESLESIAKKYKITITELKKANDLKSSRIYAGDELDIPSKKIAKTEVSSKKEINQKVKPVVSAKKENFHIVKKGESLDSISKKYGVSIKELMSLNKMKTSKVLVGAKLILQ
ncbi:MAG: LysM peptidoglycan-binding domain-containing protein [Bacteroidota bacterium]